MVVLAVILVGALVSASFRIFFAGDEPSNVELAAEEAIGALNDGDLMAVDEVLAQQRGNAEFAYLFAGKATPRALGDAIARVAGTAEGELAPGIDEQNYSIALADLAGTLALATHGTGERALPKAWTTEFINATTTLSSSSVEDGSGASEERRQDQDAANKQNLLLLIARGYWSVDFLKKLTADFWAFDTDQGVDAWPGVVDDGGTYAPAPNGTYLTDGILALTAALTASPLASEWAFTEFLPGEVTIEGTAHVVGRFTHFLMFEHPFPTSADGDSTGMTATLTALSSAIDATPGPTAPEFSAFDLKDPWENLEPERDAFMLRALADEAKEDSGCSINPLDYWNCVRAAAGTAIDWVKHWGHSVLGILSFATLAPPPFTVIGATAAATNATWYAVEGDYAAAGLSLAAAVPGLVFIKVVKAVKGSDEAVSAATKAEEVADVSSTFRRGTKAADLEDARAGAKAIERAPQATYSSEREAQNQLAESLGAKTEKYLDPKCSTTCTGRRRVDVYDESSLLCIEVKSGSGTTNLRHERTQVAKDVRLLKGKMCKAIEWHFYPGKTGDAGPRAALRAELDTAGIPYVVHVPAQTS